MWQRQTARDEYSTPQFGNISRPSNVLKIYQQKRQILTPRDAAAAFYKLGKLNRASAARINADPLANHPTAIELRNDVAASAPYLPSREVANALLGAAYMRCSNETVLSALCSAAAEKAPDRFSQRDVASVVYSLGQLGRRDEELLPKLLSRVAAEASSFHAIEMMLTAHGLADLQVAPPSALVALSRAAIPKIEQFGAEELPRLLSSLASLGFHDEQLVRLAAERLPLLLTDMTPKALSETLASLATAKMWIPAALQSLADEAVLKVDSFGAAHVAVTLAALGRLRWDHPAAVSALTARLNAVARLELGEGGGGGASYSGRGALVPCSDSTAPMPPAACMLTELAIAMRALSRLPSALDAVALPELIDTAARLLARVEREVSLGAREAEFAGGEGLTGDDAVAAWMRDPSHCRDVAMLCNGLVQLKLRPPPSLVAHLHRVTGSIERGASTLDGGGRASASSAKPAPSERRAVRRVRNELRELAISLSSVDMSSVHPDDDATSTDVDSGTDTVTP